MRRSSYLASKGVRVKTCTLWAPAITTVLFRATYMPLVKSGDIGRLALFQLDDRTERDDNCAGIYHKSLLYLVSNAFEDHRGEPLLGLAKDVDADSAIRALFANTADRVIAPNRVDHGKPDASEAKHHADFDDDEATILATLARILGSAKSAADAPVQFTAGNASRRETRRRIDKMPDFAATR